MYSFLNVKILRDPAPDASGGGAVTPPPTPTPAATTSAPPPTPTATIQVSPEEYQSLLGSRARVAEIEAETRKAAELAESKRLQTLAEKGEVEKALNTLRDAKDAEIKTANARADTLEAERLSDHKSAAVSQAMLGAEFVSPEAAADARSILDPRFEAVRDATGKISVVDKVTRRPAADVVKEWLASPASAHYRKPTTKGGAGASGGDRTAPPVDPNAPAPKNLGEALLAREIARGTNPDTSFYGLGGRRTLTPARN